jgi:hypothetical protein
MFSQFGEIGSGRGFAAESNIKYSRQYERQEDLLQRGLRLGVMRNL